MLGRHPGGLKGPGQAAQGRGVDERGAADGAGHVMAGLTALLGWRIRIGDSGGFGRRTTSRGGA